MEFLKDALDLILHLDKHLDAMIQTLGPWAYVILFLVVFCETGLVIWPFLPGDSLLFAVGAIAAAGTSLDIVLVIFVLFAAALSGDNANYWIGRTIGAKLFTKENGRIFNRKHLDRTHDFYERYGGKTIIIARFVPIVRTFAPFVAGLGRMIYLRFLTFSIGGALLWIVSLTLAGYFFGNLLIVKNNFTLVIFAIIFISILPAIIEFLRERSRLEKQRNK